MKLQRYRSGVREIQIQMQIQIQIQMQIQCWPKKRLYVRWTRREWPPCSRRGLISRLVHSLARPIASNQSKYTRRCKYKYTYGCKYKYTDKFHQTIFMQIVFDSTQASVSTKPTNSLGPMKLEPRWSLNLKTGCHNQTRVTCSRISQEHSWKRISFLADHCDQSCVLTSSVRTLLQVK